MPIREAEFNGTMKGGMTYRAKTKPALDQLIGDF